LIHVEIKILIFDKADGGNRPESYYYAFKSARIQDITRVVDPDPVVSGSEMNIPDLISESLKTIIWC
jgi:hypothetical protein